MEGVLYFFNWKEFGNMSDRFPCHSSGIESLITLDESLIVTGCEDGKMRYVDCHSYSFRMFLCFSTLSLYPHRILSTIGRTCTMPIQTLSASCDTNYLIGSSTSPETLQLIDAQQLKSISNEKKKKGAKQVKNEFFADFEANIGEEKQEEEEEEEQSSDNSSDEDDDDDDDDSDEEIRKPPKKKKKVHF